jgi:adenylate cyclase
LVSTLVLVLPAFFVLVYNICEKPIIYKTRYLYDYAGHGWSIDVYERENAGLTRAEIELKNEDEPFEKPPWALEEVTHDKRYSDAYLVKHPYSTW